MSGIFTLVSIWTQRDKWGDVWAKINPNREAAWIVLSFILTFGLSLFFKDHLLSTFFDPIEKAGLKVTVTGYHFVERMQYRLAFILSCYMCIPAILNLLYKVYWATVGSLERDRMPNLNLWLIPIWIAIGISLMLSFDYYKSYLMTNTLSNIPKYSFLEVKLTVNDLFTLYKKFIYLYVSGVVLFMLGIFLGGWGKKFIPYILIINSVWLISLYFFDLDIALFLIIVYSLCFVSSFVISNIVKNYIWEKERFKILNKYK